MSDFIKATCGVCRQYFGLKVEGRKVVDFYDIPEGQARMLASSVDIPNLKTADNLRPCFVCGKRNVSGCGCARGQYPCESMSGYHYQCIYCDKLRVFSTSEGAENVDVADVGRTIVLAQGQEVKISASGAGALEQIRVGLGWDVSRSRQNMDLDSSVVLLKRGDRSYRDVIYFANLTHPTGCVVHRGDNVVGGKSQGLEDSENIDIFLRQVPTALDVLAFVVNIYHSEDRRQTFGSVRNMYIKLSDAKSRQTLAEYNVTNNISACTSLVIGVAYRAGDSWRFKAIGKALQIGDLSDLADYCTEHYAEWI